MTQLTLNIEDPSIVPSLRRVLKSMKGVTIVRNTRKPALNANGRSVYSKEEYIAEIESAKRQAHEVNLPVYDSVDEIKALIESR